MSTVANPVGSLWSYQWDANGNLAPVIDANVNATAAQGDGTTVFSYDALNRLFRIDYSDATPDVGYVYDALGRLVEMTDGAGVETYEWDSLGRLIEVARGSDVFSYQRNAADEMTRRTYPGGTQIDLSWNDDGRRATSRQAAS